MKKKSTILKIIAILIIVMAIRTYFKDKLWIDWEEYYNYDLIYLPMIALGFSSTLFGISWLLEKDEKKIKKK